MNGFTLFWFTVFLTVFFVGLILTTIGINDREKEPGLWGIILMVFMLIVLVSIINQVYFTCQQP